MLVFTFIAAALAGASTSLAAALPENYGGAIDDAATTFHAETPVDADPAPMPTTPSWLVSLLLSPSCILLSTIITNYASLLDDLLRRSQLLRKLPLSSGPAQDLSTGGCWSNEVHLVCVQSKSPI